MTIDGEEVTFRDGRWCCSCHWFSEEGTCEHELQAIERALEGKKAAPCEAASALPLLL
jgi:hypothetical protein